MKIHRDRFNFYIVLHRQIFYLHLSLLLPSTYVTLFDAQRGVKVVFVSVITGKTRSHAYALESCSIESHIRTEVTNQNSAPFPASFKEKFKKVLKRYQFTHPSQLLKKYYQVIHLHWMYLPMRNLVTN